jgi:Zn-dependent protease with chaperone function
MADERQAQETQADKRTAELVHEARDTRARVLEALEAVDKELQRAREVARTLPDTPYTPRRRWWPWPLTLCL